MLKSDTSFGTTGRISLKNKNCSDIEISNGHSGLGKKIYNEEITDKLR